MSLIDSTYRDDINKLIECFKDTENKVKHLEQDTSELAIPSINQLRYVAYHILQASNENLPDINSVKEELSKALNHCNRAKFDALEIWVTYLLEQVKDFSETYSHIKETQDVITDYNICLSDVHNASMELQRVSDADKSREEYYRLIEPHHNKLKEIVNKFEVAKPQISVLVEHNNETKKTNTRRFIIQIGVMVLLGLGSITAITLSK